MHDLITPPAQPARDTERQLVLARHTSSGTPLPPDFGAYRTFCGT
ncbi:hypothetical protein AB0M54_41100 [Actinoplanes sp. NPDC051470]